MDSAPPKSPEPPLGRESFDALLQDLARGPSCATGAERATEATPTGLTVDTESPPVALLPAGSSLGRYRVLQVLGHGGMGVVYTAFDPHLNRRVALKVIRPSYTQTATDPESSAARTRLLREAQALARLAHPNVIAVHDVCTIGAEVAIAMELVEGTTLRGWLTERPRSWREKLGVLLQAGRGLVAAHAAGLVHRDFKPENVLVGRDERVRVLDFGLARAASGASPPTAAAASPGDLLAGSATHTAIAGTPAYMAPEQLAGADFDARADEYAFAKVAFEVIFGTRDPTRVAGSEEKIPAFVRAALRRALAKSPGDRFPTLAALLDALSRDPAAQRRRVAAAVALAALGAAALAVWQAWPAPPSPCSSEEAPFAAVWSAPRRAAMDAGFRRSGAPFAGETFGLVAARLDALATSFAAMRKDACEATRVRGEQSEELFDLRIGCLSRRLHEVDVLLSRWEHATRPAVAGASAALDALSDLSPCARVATLRAPVAPPPDPAVRAKLERIRQRIGEANAIALTAAYAEAERLAAETARDASAIGHRPVEAEALYAWGLFQSRLGKNAEAVKTLRHAAVIAQAGREERIAALAYGELSWAVGYKLGQYEEALVWLKHAAAAVERLGGDDALAAMVHLNTGRMLKELGRYAEAGQRFERAAALEQRVFGETRALTLQALANSEFDQGRYEEALALHRRTAERRLRENGSSHPDTARAYANVANQLVVLGRYDEAEKLYHRAREIVTATLGPAHPLVGVFDNNIGDTLHRRGRDAEARAIFLRLLQFRRRIFPAGHSDIGYALHNLAEVDAALGRFDDAGRELDEALAIFEKARGKAHYTVAQTLTTMAGLRLRRGDPRQALPLLERAMQIWRGAGGSARPLESAETRFALARALAALGRDGEARAVAEEARASFRAAGAPGRADLASVDAWLAKGGGRR